MLTREQLITELEERAKTLLVKLTEYKAIEDELKQTQKALFAMKGEPMPTGRPKKLDTEPAPLAAPQDSANLTMGIVQILTEHPEGLSRGDLLKAFTRPMNSNSISTALGRLKESRQIKFEQTGPRPSAGVWRLASEKEAPKKTPKKKRQGKKVETITGISSMEVLETLGTMDRPALPREVADEMKLEDIVQRGNVSIRMSHLLKRDLVTRRDDGMYKITSLGREEIAANHASAG